jgi:hypothetical protein
MGFFEKSVERLLTKSLVRNKPEVLQIAWELLLQSSTKTPSHRTQAQREGLLANQWYQWLVVLLPAQRVG